MSSFDTQIIDCVNEEELLDEFETRCEWKVYLPSSFQNNKVKENEVLCKTTSSNEYIVITSNDVLKSWSQESRANNEKA